MWNRPATEFYLIVSILSVGISSLLATFILSHQTVYVYWWFPWWIINGLIHDNLSLGFFVMIPLLGFHSHKEMRSVSGSCLLNTLYFVSGKWLPLIAGCVVIVYSWLFQSICNLTFMQEQITPWLMNFRTPDSGENLWPMIF